MPDLKITQLTDLPIPAVGDELPIAADPLGTPVTKKTKVGNLTRQILDPTAKTANYTLTTSDRFITVDASGANRTVFVPAASGNQGIVWTVKKIDSSTNTVTIDPSGSETIDGAATFVLTEQNQAISFTSNGTNLVILFNKQDNTGGSPGGSSGQVQFNNSGAFGGAAATAYAASGNHLRISALTATDIPLVLRGAASQTGNLQEWQDSAGNVLAEVTPTGKHTIYQTALNNTEGISLNRRSDGAPVMRMYLNSGSEVAIDSFGALNYGTGTVRYAGAAQFSGTLGIVGALSTMTFNTGSSFATFTSGATTVTPIVVRAAASQTADLQQWQNNAGTVLASVSATGNLNAGSGMFSVNSDINQILVSPGTRVVDNITAHWQIYQGFQVATGSSYSFSSSSSSAGIADTAISRNSAGVVEINNGTAGTWASLRVGAATAVTVPLIAKGAVSQTANLQEWQNSASTAVAGITNNGDLFLNNISGSNTTARLSHTSGNSSVFSGWLNNTTQTIGIGFNVVGQYGGGTTGTNGRNLFVYDYVSGAYRFGIGPAGDFYYGNSNTSFSVRMLPSAASNVPLAVRAAVSQTANLQEWQNSTGTVMSGIARNGVPFAYGAGNVTSNVAFGTNALFNNTTGSNNVALGAEALLRNTTGIQNVAVGGFSLAYNTTGSANLGLGYISLGSNTTGNQNLAVGYQSLYDNTTGIGNTAIGYYALSGGATGSYNIGIGINSGSNAGSYNIAIGQNAARQLQDTATYSIAIGNFALNKAAGSSNIAIGLAALGGPDDGTATGDNNVALGNYALTVYNTGNSNLAIGGYAGQQITEGNRNVIIGAYAGANLSEGSDNVVIGNEADVSNASNSIAIGAFAVLDQDNTILLGRTDIDMLVGVGTQYPNAKIHIQGVNPENTVAIFAAADTQTFNLTEWHDVSGTALALVSPTGDIEITDSTKGVILKSPDNTRWRITIDNSGALTTTSL